MSRALTRTVDAEARNSALDIRHSFIVQAPAGSGKTELLTQRFLKLLATVDRPERLLAITFTRKATQEMRHRILHRLRQAESGTVPESEHERLSIELAQRALQQDRAAGWNLLQNPGRLRILTIDGLCAQFLARDPRLGGLGAGLAVQEIAEPLYREAIENLFEELSSVNESGEDWSQARQALSRVLYLLDGDAQQLRQLLVNKLQARDQWVERIGMDASTLEIVVRERQQVELQRFVQALGSAAYARMAQLTAELGHQCATESAPARFADQSEVDGTQGAPGMGPAGFATAGLADLDIEQQIHRAWLFSRIFMTAGGSLRKPSGLTRSVFRNLPKSRDLEAKLHEVREGFELWANEQAASQAIMRMANAPPLELGQGTAGLQQDITLVLAHALARLRVLFHERGQCDFHYMTELALQSLGEEDSPGSLLLAEDARIEHILMDEFQDTSNTQYRLLRRLTSGWAGDTEAPGDGRSLFLVGDPMQSIYRFRQANVGLFIDVVQKRSLGNVPLKYLQLRANFRSNEEIVTWINKQFAGIFPPLDERDSGAVQYASAAAAKGNGGNVMLHAFPPKTTAGTEAQQVVQLVQQAQAELGNPSIGILGRARRHLEHIARALQQAGIPAQAVKIDALQERPVVRDLIALTRALSHPGDRIAWLAVLRAPWAGLTVAELHQVAGNLANTSILSSLQSAADETEDVELAARLKRVAKIMSLAESRRAEESLRNRVEAAWLGLGGPWCYASAAELDHARTFLNLLDELERESIENLETRLSRSLQELYAASPASRLQLMTIHQAKGLEFDVVIVPGMARKPRADGQVLVAMQEFRNESGVDSSLLAPLPPRVKPAASLYAYLRAVEVERSAFEQQRLLYVACTRARQQLHLLGTYSESRNDGPCAPKGSLMEMLFPAFAEAVRTSQACDMQESLSGAKLPHAAEDDEDSAEENEFSPAQAYPLLQLQNAPLLPVGLVAGAFAAGSSQAADSQESGSASERLSTWADSPIDLPELPNRQSVALGSAVHAWLELIHDHWEQGWSSTWFEQHPEALIASLVRGGLSSDEAAEQLQHLQHMLIQVIDSTSGRAIVSPEDKQQSWTELPLVRRDGYRISRNIIDRLYEEEGALTIVDYKTGGDSKDTRELWIGQLQRYRQLVSAVASSPVSNTTIYLTNEERVIDLTPETLAAE